MELSTGHVRWDRTRGTPYQAVRATARLPESLKEHLPRRWERIGEVLVLRLPPELEAHREAVGEAYGRALRAQAVVEETDGIRGAWRTPQTRPLWGEDTETVHQEYGIRYRLDPTQVMFSSGNLAERRRMGTVCRPDEAVVDMFAGVGYFALPMALHGGARRVVACEINPTAFRYLCENVQMNGAATVEARLGDCRKTVPEDMADRVVMGYLRDTFRFLPAAFRALRDQGWIHYHEACPDPVADRLERRLRTVAEEVGRTVESWDLRRVKAYAPGVSHWVLDAHIT
ncbi:MAG: class I SAM-dependent methyltransferase family protein [Candidatus Thermoplasmatota archaeon]|nr:class I SAM-dependent methyltransferase family protein [Candidatus Thermoplasmatota archaeon]